MERGTAASSGEGEAYCTALYGTYANWLVTSIAAAFGTATNSPNHFSRAQRSAMARELCGSRISYPDDRNNRYVDARSLGSSRNGRRGQRQLETFAIRHSPRGGRMQIMSLVTAQRSMPVLYISATWFSSGRTDIPEIHPEIPPGGISKKLNTLLIPSSGIPRSRSADSRRWLDRPFDAQGPERHSTRCGQ
jgi:hypothetical protein